VATATRIVKKTNKHGNVVRLNKDELELGTTYLHRYFMYYLLADLWPRGVPPRFRLALLFPALFPYYKFGSCKAAGDETLKFRWHLAVGASLKISPVLYLKS
jgi:hypothetical protein